jgi:hypothetical protein
VQPRSQEGVELGEQRCIKLPNGQIRIRRADFERWLDALEEAAA